MFAQSNLKKIRVIVSIVFLLLISLIFIDPQNSIPQWLTNFLVSLQIVPSITKILVYFGITSLGLFAIILLTITFGRVYCSSICPFGTLQDLIIYFKRKIFKRKHFKYQKPPYYYHYSILVLVTTFAVLGSIILLSLLEPFSNYGRILTNLVEPIIILINNILGELLEKFEIFFIYKTPLRIVDTSVLIISSGFLVLIIFLSLNFGRFFCNSLCPAGALLGLISRISIFKIKIDRKICAECGACEKVCKASCIDSSTKKIEFAACIGCFNCIKVCPTSGILYARITHKNKQSLNVKIDASRRRFLKETFTPLVTLPALKGIGALQINQNVFAVAKKYPISPPGSKSIKHFSSFCTACHLCVGSCPTQVLYPAILDYGISGIFQPKMNYEASYCNYECVVCTQICPSGAILPIDVEKKKITQIGKAYLSKEDCISCAACAEHCPTQAVYMVPYKEDSIIPEIDNDYCIGCGACEYVCPTSPDKAIFVRANNIHLTVKKPKVEKQEIKQLEEFPF